MQKVSGRQRASQRARIHNGNQRTRSIGVLQHNRPRAGDFLRREERVTDIRRHVALRRALARGARFDECYELL